MFSYPTFSMLLKFELIYSTFWSDYEPQSFDFKHKGTKTLCLFRYRKIQRAAKAAFTKATKFFIRNALWRLLSRLLSLFPEKELHSFVPLCL